MNLKKLFDFFGGGRQTKEAPPRKRESHTRGFSSGPAGGGDNGVGPSLTDIMILHALAGDSSSHAGHDTQDDNGHSSDCGGGGGWDSFFDGGDCGGGDCGGGGGWDSGGSDSFDGGDCGGGDCTASPDADAIMRRLSQTRLGRSGRSPF